MQEWREEMWAVWVKGFCMKVEWEREREGQLCGKGARGRERDGNATRLDVSR